MREGELVMREGELVMREEGLAFLFTQISTNKILLIVQSCCYPVIMQYVHNS